MGFFPKASWTQGKKPLNVIAQCGACGLHKTCQSPKMPVTGSGKVPILFLGEFPGKTEDEQNQQFVGKAGQCLKDMLAHLRLDIDDCWKQNSFRCHPSGNLNEDKYVDYCRPNVLADIKRLKPKVIVPMGLMAIQSVIGPEWGDDLGTVKRWAGWRIPSLMHNAWIVPTYHPSFVLRTNEDAPLVNEVIRHLEIALDAVNEPLGALEANRLADQVEVITDPRQGAKRIAELAKSKELVAWDYETTGLKPERKEQKIYSFAAAVDGDCFSTLIDESCFDALREFLTNDALKVASNLKFETRWSKRKLGVWVKNWKWDTMLTAHYSNNKDGITSIKFQTYIRYGIGDYNSTIEHYLKSDNDNKDGANGLNTIQKAPVKDICRYNGLDAMLELMVALEQMQELEFEL